MSRHSTTRGTYVCMYAPRCQTWDVLLRAILGVHRRKQRRQQQQQVLVRHDQFSFLTNRGRYLVYSVIISNCFVFPTPRLRM